MCGIAGFFTPAGFLREWALGRAQAMGDAIAHRGPDDSGEWLDGEAGIALAHRRLSIVDLSPAGHQPMRSDSGRYVVVFNGEIYNHADLRAELGKRDWRGRSDTETLLACVERWGLNAALKRCIGMFALALWDRQERLLALARDRFGEKPLYYGWQGETFVFGSEIKAFKRHPAFVPEVDRDALSLYLRHGYIPAPYSIHRGLRKLLPGTLLRVGAQDRETEPVPEAYWTLAEAVAQGRSSPFRGSEEEAVLSLQGHLSEAVRSQMMSDVPLGAFLSGGIDSSTIVAMMQSLSARPVKTFTIGFEERGYNEAEHAKAVARHLGTDHAELYVSATDAMAVIPRLPSIYDEPFADPSAIPTFLVSRLAKSRVTVSLSGDGGDETFGGYSSYLRVSRRWVRAKSIPLAARRSAAWLIEGFAGHGRRLHAYAEMLRARDEVAFYRSAVSQWKSPARMLKDGCDPETPWVERGRHCLASTPYERMMCADTLGYLPDNVLAKVDRAGMAVGLESRVPLLDPRVVEFAWSLPTALKVRDVGGKWILRQVLGKFVPQNLFERPKMGFGVPLDDWLRGPLRGWAEELLSERRLEAEGFFHPAAIRQCWRDHVSGRDNCRDPLWVVLMFQAWLAER